MNAVQSKNLEINPDISHTLLIFGEIKVYLCKIIMDLKNINCRKNSYSVKIANFASIFSEITACLYKRKKTHFKTVSYKKSLILLIFDGMVVYLPKKSCI